MHFDPEYSSKHLLISQSGLAVCVSEKDTIGYAIADRGFSQGVHYWEINCPLSCEGIQVFLYSNYHFLGWNHKRWILK